MTHWFKYNLGRNEEFLFIHFLISFISNSGKAKAFKCVLVNVQIYVHYITVSRWMVIPSHRFGHISSQCFFFFWVCHASRINSTNHLRRLVSSKLTANYLQGFGGFWFLKWKWGMESGKTVTHFLEARQADQHHF